MRELISQEFFKILDQFPRQVERIAILGGSSSDYEISNLKIKYPNAEIIYFNLVNHQNDESWQKLDIDSDSIHKLSKNFHSFDLVICSQVLEHIWNHKNFFDLLYDLVCTDGGFVFISVPASNRFHGSPYYYSAGFTSNYLSKNLINLGFSILESKSFGSHRYYFMSHIMRIWPAQHELNYPLKLKYFKTPKNIRSFFAQVKNFFFRIWALFLKSEISENLEYATETLIMAKLEISKSTRKGEE